MGDPTSLATLAVVAMLAVERVVTKCNLYPVGVKTLDCEASKCFSFHIVRSSGGTPTMTTPQPSGSMQPLSLPTTSTELAELAAQTARRLSSPEGQDLPPLVQKMG